MLTEQRMCPRCQAAGRVVSETCMILCGELEVHLNLNCGHFCNEDQPLTTECGLLDENYDLMNIEQLEAKVAEAQAQMSAALANSRCSK